MESSEDSTARFVPASDGRPYLRCRNRPRCLLIRSARSGRVTKCRALRIQSADGVWGWLGDAWSRMGD